MRSPLIKTAALLLSILLLQLNTFSQGIITGDARQLNQTIHLDNVLDLSVCDRDGNLNDLRAYIAAHRSYATKPVLILMTGKIPADSVLAICNSGVMDAYSVIFVYKSDKKGKEMGIELDKKLKDAAIQVNCNTYMQVSANAYDVIDKAYQYQMPRYIYLDRDLNTVTDNFGSDPKHIMGTLKAINAGKITKGKAWFDKNDNIVAPDDPDALTWINNVFAGGRLTASGGEGAKQLFHYAHKLQGTEYFADGVWSSETATGQKTLTGEFKDGIPVTPLNQWYDNGTPKMTNPVNGTLKMYDKTGAVEGTGPVVNGLGNGLFTMYASGKKTNEYNYVNGVLIGLQKAFENDVVTGQYFASPNYQAVSYLKDNIQRVKVNGLYGYADNTGKIVIAAIYTGSSEFTDGKASVTDLTGTYYIDRAGVKITDEAAQKRDYFGQRAQVFDTRNEIVDFLQKNLIPNVKGYSLMPLEEARLTTERMFVKLSSIGQKDVIFRNMLGIAYTKTSEGSTGEIKFTGKMPYSDHPGEYTWEQKYSIDASVPEVLLYQIVENLKKLCTLNGAQLLLNDATTMTKKAILSELGKITSQAQGGLIEDNKYLESDYFTDDKYTYNFKEGKTSKDPQTVSDINWDKFDRITFNDPAAGAQLTKLCLWFNDAANIKQGPDHVFMAYNHFYYYIKNEKLDRALTLFKLLKNINDAAN